MCEGLLDKDPSLIDQLLSLEFHLFCSLSFNTQAACEDLFEPMLAFNTAAGSLTHIACIPFCSLWVACVFACAFGQESGGPGLDQTVWLSIPIG